MITVWLLLIVLTTGEGRGKTYPTLEECEMSRTTAIHATDVTDLSQCIRIDVEHK